MADSNETPTPAGAGVPKGQRSLGNDAPLDNAPAAPNQRTTPPPAVADKRIVTPIYRAIMLAAESRRLALGIPMESFSEFAGVPDRYFTKALHPDTPSGRQSQWGTLQIIADTLWPDGFDLKIVARKGPKLDALRMQYALRYDKTFADSKTRREQLAEWGRRGGLKRQAALTETERRNNGKRLARNRAEKLPPAERARLASRASQARWAKARADQSTPDNSGQAT